jgi:hypothetical protein
MFDFVFIVLFTLYFINITFFSICFIITSFFTVFCLDFNKFFDQVKFLCLLFLQLVINQEVEEHLNYVSLYSFEALGHLYLLPLSSPQSSDLFAV